MVDKQKTALYIVISRKKGAFHVKTNCYVQSHVGTTRQNNEDNYYCCGAYHSRLQSPIEELLQAPDGKMLLFAVFDGMGGEAAGERAALICAETLEQARLEGGSFEAPAYYHRANAAVTSLGQSLGGTSGSTAAIACLRANRLFVSNVGDSRIYHLRGNALRCLTYDHTRYQQMTDSGYTVIDESERHVLTQFLGMGIRRPMSPHFAVSVPLQEGDRILLCTDGVSGTLSDSEILELLKSPGGPEQAGRALISAAMESGSTDNVTAMVADVVELEEGEDEFSAASSDAPVTRRFDLPDPELIAQQERELMRARQSDLRKSIWLVLLALFGVLAVSGGIIYLALFHAPDRDAAGRAESVDVRSAVCYNPEQETCANGVAYHV